MADKYCSTPSDDRLAEQLGAPLFGANGAFGIARKSVQELIAHAIYRRLLRPSLGGIRNRGLLARLAGPVRAAIGPVAEVGVDRAAAEPKQCFENNSSMNGLPQPGELGSRQGPGANSPVGSVRVVGLFSTYAYRLRDWGLVGSPPSGSGESQR